MVLFAYREIPRETTGFTPFELLYSRDVKGPMDILKDQWIGTQPEKITLPPMFYHSVNVWKKAQTKQKQWYDQHAREKSYIPGDQDLLLLPDSTQNFKAFKKRIGNVNYELEMPERKTSIVTCLNDGTLGQKQVT